MASLGLRLIGYFLPRMITLLNQGVVQIGQLTRATRGCESNGTGNRLNKIARAVPPNDRITLEMNLYKSQLT